MSVNSDVQASSATSTDRLDSWKEIAVYLRRDVRTVQLWEKKEGLPVHRHFHKRLGSIFAFRSEIDHWKRQVSRTNRDREPVQPVNSRTASRYTIYSLPPENLSVRSDRRELCGLVVAKTIAALEEANPAQLRIAGALAKHENTSKSQDKSPQRGSIDYLLRWSFQDAGAALRMTVTLQLADSEAVVWSHTYRCDQNDFVDLPGYAANQIVQCLWLKVFSSPTSPTACHQLRPGARESYLKGRYFWNQRSEQGLRKAIHYFESAMREDPEFGLPYSGLADSLTLLSFYEIVPPSEIMPAARRAAQKAIELDPNSAEAHASLADVFLHFDRDWHAADGEYRRSIQCNPEYALGYHWYANLLAARGQHEAAHMAIMHALEINPVSIITRVWAGVTSHLARHFDEAVRHYQSALELDPQFVWAHMYMAQALEQKGHFEMALQEFETSSRLAGGNNCVKAMMAHTYAVSGDTSAAREILDELSSASSHQCIPSYDIAATYAALGEPHRMVAWLNRACKEGNMKLFTLTQDPRFDPLRHYSGFKQILDQVGLPQASMARS